MKYLLVCAIGLCILPLGELCVICRCLSLVRVKDNTAVFRLVVCLRPSEEDAVGSLILLFICTVSFLCSVYVSDSPQINAVCVFLRPDCVCVRADRKSKYCVSGCCPIVFIQMTRSICVNLGNSACAVFNPMERL